MNDRNDIAVNPIFSRFRNITPVNGFDASDPDNARQNNYAWSMTELDGYLYVGTARNIPYSIFSSGILGDIPVPEELTPENPVMAGEIWRYPLDGRGNWERVYRSPENMMNLGFRFMITYTTPNGETAIYAGALTLTPNLFMLKSVDGITWYPLDSGITGFSTRYMTEHLGKLYMGALPLTGQGGIQLYSSLDPEKDGWELVDVSGDPDKNPGGNVDLLLSYNGHLYVGTGLYTGFELWRTLGEEPEKDNWKLVVDKGAGDARNEHPWALAVFKDHIYIGTAIEAAVLSLNPDDPTVPPKGFDVIRVDREDNWELIVGGEPVVPTQPTTGTRGKALSGYASGFGNISNAYCWQIEAQGDELYLGTFSWSVLIPPFLPILPDILAYELSGDIKQYRTMLLETTKLLTRPNPNLPPVSPDDVLPELSSLLAMLGRRVFGFDLWKTRDGIHWAPVSLNGLGNPHNYGVRMLYLAGNGNLFLGTANPFEGLEVWVKPWKAQLGWPVFNR